MSCTERLWCRWRLFRDNHKSYLCPQDVMPNFKDKSENAVAMYSLDRHSVRSGYIHAINSIIYGFLPGSIVCSSDTTMVHHCLPEGEKTNISLLLPRIIWYLRSRSWWQIIFSCLHNISGLFRVSGGKLITGMWIGDKLLEHRQAGIQLCHGALKHRALAHEQTSLWLLGPRSQP